MYGCYSLVDDGYLAKDTVCSILRMVILRFRSRILYCNCIFDKFY